MSVIMSEGFAAVQWPSFSITTAVCNTTRDNKERCRLARGGTEIIVPW